MVEWDTTEEISPWKRRVCSLLKKVSGQALIGLGLFIILTDWGILLVSVVEQPVQAKTNWSGEELPFIMLIHALLLFCILRQFSKNVSSIFAWNHQRPLKSIEGLVFWTVYSPPALVVNEQNVTNFLSSCRIHPTWCSGPSCWKGG